MTAARGMDRREFCRLLAGAALLGAAGPLVSGCGRLLDWSSTNEDVAQRSMAGAGGPATVTSGTAGGAPSTTVGTSGPTTTAPAGATTTTTGFEVPDLAVVTGDDPAANVRAALAMLGGMGRFVAKGNKVVLKPNVLTGRAPEYAVTTNPQVLAALVTLCYEAGASAVTVLDSPTSSPRAAFEESGIAQAVSAVDGQVKYLTGRNFEKIEIPQGKLLRSWPLVTDVFDADVFINVPIAKTHGMAGLTMSMKNLMGIMGGARGTIHVDFAQKIVDVNSLVRPHLVVLDAYRILTRNGPTGGNLADVKTLKTVVAGTDQVAVDAYGAGFFGVQPADLGYLVKAAEQGLGTIDLARLSVQKGQA